jgi:predicted RNA binding protein YcfA (HicA-like mRNA interferase family)
MSDELPPISGYRLIKLLVKDGWEIKRKKKHFSLAKRFADGRTRVTVIQNTKKELPIGTLKAILKDDQTGLGREGFLKLYKRK